MRLDVLYTPPIRPPRKCIKLFQPLPAGPGAFAYLTVEEARELRDKLGVAIQEAKQHDE